MKYLGCIGHSPNCCCATCSGSRMVSESETVELIKLSFPDRILPLRFGPGWAALDYGIGPGNWAYDALADMRSRGVAIS